MNSSIHVHPSLSKLARDLYRDASLGRRLIQSWRPHICPFATIIEHVGTAASVFDIGCGAGAFLGMLAGLGRISHGVGVDADTAAVAIATQMGRQFAEGETRLEFVVSSSWHDWPDETFDVVTMIDVLHHVPVDLRRTFVVEASKRVGPSGVLVYKDMCRRPRWRALANQLHDLVMARQWVRHVAVSGVESWAVSQGLELTHREDIPVLWYGHELRVFKRSE